MTIRRLGRGHLALRHAVSQANGIRLQSSSRPWLISHAPSPPGVGLGEKRRSIHSNAFILPPLMFTGLLAAMWVWKCFMMIVFQNKIIYMPGLPPNARSERIETYEKECTGVRWRAERTRAEDGTDIALAVGDVTVLDGKASSEPSSHLYILYFQGRLKERQKIVNHAATSPGLT